ncbi:arylamine N-acetyltransferase [Chryseobacterium arthrosphaerae]|uniref:arylamine N-acetyltransferase family protein n=1 Tax=Chryseobacterium arthrosphaerae TaxID=651561 RepID=UPI0023E219AA|nr:arylamine N-acetyltransferase [Chryseobacterium arthrosphaerae]WES98473.1 arylamine N-acetyltransferase [Chryseobacterium arthrosphaerae]
MKDLELKNYLKRIGLSERVTGNLETLKKLTQLHPKHITFENIDSFTRTVPSIKTEDIFDKLVSEKRGGYCYEQNSLFKDVLQTLGFHVRMHLARVLWSSKDGSETARTHMLLTTEIKGEKYLVDVGFGSMTLTAPIRFNTEPLNSEQETPNGRFRLVHIDSNFYRLDVFNKEWLPIYKFSLEEVQLTDIDMANWYVATGPSSMFNKFLMITRVDENARYALFNKEFVIRYNIGKKESSKILNEYDLKSVFEKYFNLNLEASKLKNIYSKLDEDSDRFKIEKITL